MMIVQKNVQNTITIIVRNALRLVVSARKNAAKLPEQNIYQKKIGPGPIFFRFNGNIHKFCTKDR
ncbi:hypothetical protein MJ3_07443 [Salimicrobium jeotgali]|uniref:Uncharacterized protein n=1 Tax=Salimicrobium jeotgali TaxID=1230341 RepID=K2FKR8_9BACI|nr:hypothetical protein MJ3_07443 [Salimicrobium jeotgali]